MFKIMIQKFKNQWKKIPVLELLASEVFGLFESFIVKYPNTAFGFWIRKKYWSSKCKLGSNPFLCQGVVIHASKKESIDMGDNLQLGNDVVINVGQCKGLFIGNNVSIAIRTFIRSGNHKFTRLDIPINMQGHDFKTVNFNNKEYSIVIEDDCWIGAQSVLLSGAHLGKGCVVSAGAVVSGVISPYSIVVGNPARVIGSRLKRMNND